MNVPNSLSYVYVKSKFLLIAPVIVIVPAVVEVNATDAVISLSEYPQDVPATDSRYSTPGITWNINFEFHQLSADSNGEWTS